MFLYFKFFYVLKVFIYIFLKLLEIMFLRIGWEHENEPENECTGDVHSRNVDCYSDGKTMCLDWTLPTPKR